VSKQHISLAGNLGVAYPEQQCTQEGSYEAWLRDLFGTLRRPLRARSSRFCSIIARVNAYGDEVGGLPDSKLKALAGSIGQQMRREGFTEPLVARSFATAREAAGRHLGMRHYDVQLIGGWVMLNGMVAEMETGEGKTLTATLAAATAALAGVPVHIVTSNDYLANRDADWMRPLYEALGLRVGTVIHGLDKEGRQEAYCSNITYCSNKEVAFDFLKDRISLGNRSRRLQVKLEQLYVPQGPVNQLLLRGLFFGIVDEADNVLVDEARTPLIISGEKGAPEGENLYLEALALASDLSPGQHFVLHERERRLEFTARGKVLLEQKAEGLGGIWQGPHRREEFVIQALSALHLYRKDVDYLLRDDKVQIVDGYTGRVLKDRSWEQGLHQMIEAKEGVTITGQGGALARTSFQRFFRRYLHLAGMTGTARELTDELWSTYRLEVVRIPTNRPIRRHQFPTRVYNTEQQKWTVVAERIAALHQAGRPVLVGTRSVASSETLSAVLTEAGLLHQVLNARQDQEEAEVVARAGQQDAITVATSMAGRGTDIMLGAGVAEAGGLHVIATELHDAGRIDRQLFGRCGRQGDLGSYEMLLSLEDELVQVYAGRLLRRLVRWMNVFVPLRWLVPYLLHRAQRRVERHHYRIRRDLLKLDERLEESLAFSGRREP